MEVFFKNTFIKDFERLPERAKKEVREICFSIFPKIKNLSELILHSFRKISGFKNYYRIRVGNFRIGFKKTDHQIIFMRVKHRKDIYRYFP